MQLKIGMVVLGASLMLMLFGGNTVEAKSTKTDKKSETTTVKVKAGDTLSSIAKKHHTTYVRLFNANTKIQNPDVIDVGEKVRIPAKKAKLKDRFDAIAAQQVTSYVPAPGYVQQSAPAGAQYHGSSNGNTYAWGNCTWYVKSRRSDLPNMLGNGGSWAANAAAQGFKTGSTPRAGAVAEEAGHVAYVESVNKNGSVNVSEMNYGGALDKVHKRTVPASQFSYIY